MVERARMIYKETENGGLRFEIMTKAGRSLDMTKSYLYDMNNVIQ